MSAEARAVEQAAAAYLTGPEFIKALVAAWECCGTCAGGLLAAHDREVARAALTAASPADPDQDGGA